MVVVLWTSDETGVLTTSGAESTLDGVTVTVKDCDTSVSSYLPRKCERLTYLRNSGSDLNCFRGRNLNHFGNGSLCFARLFLFDGFLSLFVLYIIFIVAQVRRNFLRILSRGRRRSSRGRSSGRSINWESRVDRFSLGESLCNVSISTLTETCSIHNNLPW